jgi:hypothetical protein
MRASVLFVLLLAAAPATAQTSDRTYVGASILREFARYGGVDVEDDETPVAPELELSRDGDATGFAVTAGRALGDRWGVELEVARGGSIENGLRQRVGPRLVDVPVLLPPGIPFPEFEFELHIEQRHTTIVAAAWVRQDIGRRVGLALLGGVSFIRVETEQEIRNVDPRLALFAPYPREIETVEHGTGPVIGADVIVGLATRLAVTAGVRLHGVDAGGSGWLVRPAAGLRWSF